VLLSPAAASFDQFADYAAASRLQVRGRRDRRRRGRGGPERKGLSMAVTSAPTRTRGQGRARQRGRGGCPDRAVRRAIPVALRAPSAGGLAAPVDAPNASPHSIVLAVVIALPALGS